jgi:hypothetical protein
MVGREKEVVKHLSREDLDRLQAETDNLKTYKRLTFSSISTTVKR